MYILSFCYVECMYIVLFLAGHYVVVMPIGGLALTGKGFMKLLHDSDSNL